MKIGYIRVSTKKQNVARQETLMGDLLVDKVYIEKVSGKDINRPELNKMMDNFTVGDTLIVESISRFARNTKDLLELAETLERKGIKFISKKENIDTTTASGRFVLTLFGAIAELEREYLLDRQAEGIAEAKKLGIYKGRKRKSLDDFDFVYQSWKAKKINLESACKMLNCSESTFFRRCREK